MVDPDEIAHGSNPNPSMPSVDAKMLCCRATPADAVSKVGNTSVWPVPVPPLDDENLLQDILIRLPPQPSSLPRASLVCTRWCNILSDPDFLKRYRKHHRKPLLLGFFTGKPLSDNLVFTSILEPPDRIPSTHFPVPRTRITCESWIFSGCRHGLAVLLEVSRREIIVWDPLTGQELNVTFPPAIDNNERFSRWDATVLCADAAVGHVHGDCFSSPFKLVLIWVFGCTQAYSCIYESASGVWGEIVSTTCTDTMCHTRSNVLVRNALYWLLRGCDIIAFDLERQNLGVIEKPADANIIDYYGSVQLLRTEDSRLGLAFSSGQLAIQLWERKSNCGGVVGWVLLQKINPLEVMFSWGMPSDNTRLLLVGYDEDTNVIVLSTRVGKFILQLESMQIKKISETDDALYIAFYPYTNFYTAETAHEDEEALGPSNHSLSLRSKCKLSVF